MKKRYLMVLLLSVSSFVNAMKTTNVVNPNNWDAEKYKVNSTPQFLAVMKVLSHINFNEADDVFDIGSGDGKVTREIAKKVPHGKVKGIDVSSNMVFLASKDHADMPNLSFEHANITNYTSEQKFDYALSYASFAWIKDQQKALINIADVLKPGGKFVGGIAHKDSAYLCSRYKMLTNEKWEKYFVNYEVPYYPLNEDIIKELCKNAGFTTVIAERKESPYVFGNREAFIKFMQALPIQLDKIPQEHQVEFLNDIINDYIKEVPENEDGSITLSLSGLLVVAQK
jgi:trans-aconitate methyltransferase